MGRATHSDSGGDRKGDVSGNTQVRATAVPNVGGPAAEAWARVAACEDACRDIGPSRAELERMIEACRRLLEALEASTLRQKALRERLAERRAALVAARVARDVKIASALRGVSVEDGGLPGGRLQ